MCQGHSPRDKLVFNKLQNFQKIGFGEIYGLNLSEWFSINENADHKVLKLKNTVNLIF